MPKFYTALNVQQYAQLLVTKNMPLTIGEGAYRLYFTEDADYWVAKLKAQEDLEHVADYQYSILLEFEMNPKMINDLIESEETGHFSQKMVDYYKTINKPLMIKPLHHTETNVLCIEDVYESEETEDGISQLWLLKTDSKESDIWKTFSQAIHKIACIGAIPGAVEAADAL
jgi:hypothetical protein